MDLSLTGYLLFFSAAVVVGLTKTSVGGFGLLSVLLITLAVPGKMSVGALLPMLIVADLMAIAAYRQHCDWKLLIRLFPAIAIGVIAGYFVLDAIDPARFNIFIGCLILLILAFGYLIEKRRELVARLSSVGWVFGIFGGVASMVSNAAGPIFEVYFLHLRLAKEVFVGTRAWTFFIMNSFKVPFALSLGLISKESLTLNLFAIPFILLGAFGGYWLLKVLSERVFRNLIRITALIAAFRLILY